MGPLGAPGAAGRRIIARMKLVIVDRDGTLNVEREGFLQSPDDWQALPGALDAIARLNHAGFQVVIAANWPGLGRGQVDMATVNAIHARMNKQLAAAGGRIEAIYFCPHAPDEGCTCRKPATGLIDVACARATLAVRPTWPVAVEWAAKKPRASNASPHCAPRCYAAIQVAAMESHAR